MENKENKIISAELSDDELEVVNGGNDAQFVEVMHYIEVRCPSCGVHHLVPSCATVLHCDACRAKNS